MMADRREGMNDGLMEGKQFIRKAGLEVESQLVVYMFHGSLDSLAMLNSLQIVKNILSFTRLHISAFSSDILYNLPILVCIYICQPGATITVN
jgi:hypothetical protein